MLRSTATPNHTRGVKESEMKKQTIRQLQTSACGTGRWWYRPMRRAKIDCKHHPGSLD